MKTQRFYRSWFVLILLCLLSAFVLSACGGDDEDPEGNDDSDAETTDGGSEEEEFEEEESEDEGGDDGAIAPVPDVTMLEIVNATETDICVIAVSPSDASDWGANLLEGSSLAAGESFSTDELEPNRYDVLAQDCEENEVQMLTGNDLEGPHLWEIGGGIEPMAVASSGDGGDGDDGGEAPTASGDVLMSTGFSVDADGFSFSNYGSEKNPNGDMTAQEMVEIFDEGVCASYDGDECILTPTAQQFMEMTNEQNNEGTCSGFSVLAMRMMAGQASPGDYGGDSVYSLSDDSELLHDLARDFGMQFLTAGQEGLVGGSPAELVNMILEYQEPIEVGIMMEGEGGHSVLAYEVRDAGNDIYHVMVYDSNWPGKERYIEVNMAENTWLYALAAINPTESAAAWQGDTSTESMFIRRLDVYNLNQGCYADICAASLPAGTFAKQAASGNVYVSMNYQGEIIGAEDAIEIPVFGVRSNNNPPVLIIPANRTHNLQMQGQGGKPSKGGSLRMFGSGFAMAVKGLNTGSGTSEELIFDAETRTGGFRSGGGQRPVVSMAVDNGDGTYTVVSFSSGEFDEGDEMILGIDSETGALTIDANGLDGEDIDMLLANLDEDGVDLFASTDMGFTDEGLFGLDLESWNGDGEVGFLIDAEGDGEFEESVGLEEAELSELMEGVEDSDDVFATFGEFMSYMDEEESAEFVEGLEGAGLDAYDLDEVLDYASEQTDEDIFDDAAEEHDTDTDDEDSGEEEATDDAGDTDSGDDGSNDSGDGSTDDAGTDDSGTTDDGGTDDGGTTDDSGTADGDDG